MISNTPEYLVEEVKRVYGVDVPLEVAMTYLESDESLTPETLYMYVCGDRENSKESNGELKTIPKGFTCIDLAIEKNFLIPRQSGNYIWLIKDSCEFPQIEGMPTPVFNRIELNGKSYRVMYTGKAKDLYKRLWRNHLSGKIATSTLRKTLAALFNYKFEHYMSGNTPKVRITPNEENRITRWLNDNCILLFKTYVNIGDVEQRLIKNLDPPLNIDDNPNINNGEYVSQLSVLRRNGGSGNGKGFLARIEKVFRKLFVGKVFEGTFLVEDKVMMWVFAMVFALVCWMIVHK